MMAPMIHFQFQSGFEQAGCRLWHIADNPVAPAFVRYWSNKRTLVGMGAGTLKKASSQTTMFQFVRPVNKIIKVLFDSLPWWQCLDPGQPSRYKVESPRECFNRHELVSSDIKYPFYNRNFEDFTKDKDQHAENEVPRRNEIRAERLYRF
jgi:predicted N-acyltransferase